MVDEIVTLGDVDEIINEVDGLIEDAFALKAIKNSHEEACKIWRKKVALMLKEAGYPSRITAYKKNKRDRSCYFC